MNELRVKYVSFQTTNICTLNCKLCTACIPYLSEHKCFDTSESLKALDKLFEVYDYIEQLDFSGGEPLTNPDIEKIMKYVLKYKEKCGCFRLITNGTIVPSEELLEIMASDKKYAFCLDHYGELSKNIDTVKKLIEEKGIKYQLNIYHGEKQWYDGWVDLGIIEDKGYSEEAFNAMFRKCHAANWMCLAVLKGKMYQCVHAGQIVDLGYCEPKEGDVLDLLDETTSLEKKREIAANFGKIPSNACRMCNGFDNKDGKRFPAAEQMKK